MSHVIKVHQFEGPLDLLLNLIEEQKLNITEIALAEVTEQFLRYIRQLEQLDPTSLADYLSIAAKLLVIKSKAILPTLEIEAEDEDIAIDLTEKLLLYKQFKEVARYLKQLDGKQQQSFTRTILFTDRISFLPDPQITSAELYKAIRSVLEGLQELDSLPTAKIKEAVSIQEKIDQLQMTLSSQIETKLSDLLAGAKNKSEAIVTFLALLELIKQKIFTVEQEALFTDVTIRKFESGSRSQESDQETGDK
jgi:segregation and condensation protein A